MAELPNAFEKPSSPTPDQLLSPVMRDLKSRINDPVNFKLINDAYTASNDEERTLLIKLIEKNTTEIGDCADSPDDMTKLLNSIIKESKSELKTKTIETNNEVKSTNKEIKSITVKIDNNSSIDENLLTKERLKKADEQLAETYALFGDKKGFEAKFAGQIDTWKKDATVLVESKAKKDGVKLSPEELDTRVQVSMIASNREAIAKELTGENLKRFENISGQLNKSADDLGIPVSRTLTNLRGYTADQVEKITTELVGLKSTDRVTQTGSEFRYGNDKDGYQVVDVSTYPPTRSIESTDGIRITQPNTDKKKDYYDQADRYQRDYDATQAEIRNIKGEVSSELNLLKQYADRLHLGSIDKLDESSYDQVLQALGKELQGAEKGTPEYDDIDRLGKKIAERKQKYLEPGGLKEKQQKLKDLTTKLGSIDTAKILQRELYLESLKTETESSRSNLEYLESTRLTSLLGDAGTKLLIEQINRTTPDKFSSLTLETQWGPREKELFANGLKKLLSLDARDTHEFFESDGYTMKRYAPDLKTPIDIPLKQRLEKNGVYGGIPPAVIQSHLIAVMNGEKKYNNA